MTRARDLADSADKDIVGTITVDGLTVAGNVSVDGGTIKLDGNYPTGTQNVALGGNTFTAIESGANYNTAFGYRALEDLTTGDQNTAVGRQALADVTTGSNNTAVGMNAADSTTSGGSNVAVGRDALQANTTASNNTAVGYQAGYSNTTGDFNIGIGIQPLYDNTTGVRNIAIGATALGDNTTANDNIAVGHDAMRLNTTGASNVAMGFQSLRSNTTASNNTAVGYQAGYSNTTGADNFFSGYFSGYANTTASNNIGVGSSSLRFNTTGANNVAVGTTALFSNTTASDNTAVGYQSFNANTTGNKLVAVGYQAGYSNTTGVYNQIFGERAGYNNTTGSYNTYIGQGSGYYMTTGSNNTFIGRYSGTSGGLDLRTSSNNIVLSDGDGNPYVAIGPSNSAVENNVNTGGDTVVLGRVGSNAVGATTVVIGDIFGANYSISGGGYGLTFAKAVATSGTTTPTSYANALQITASGTTDTTPDVHINNTLSKGSGSFRIEHPLPSKSETHDLVHSFIEGPKADLIYRGKVDLVNGTASVNIDTEATMTDGTFEVLCRDVQCFTSNETGWTAVKGSVTRNVLTIVAQENTCTDTISWMVVGERKDPKMRSSSLTDDDGNMIVEPLRRVDPVIDYENA